MARGKYIGPLKMSDQAPTIPKSAWIYPVTGTLLLLIAWAFPKLWFIHTGPQTPPFWLVENTNIAGWTYSDLKVDESTEGILVADKLENGEFRGTNGAFIRTFSCKTLRHNNETSIYAHTPDLCWQLAGWIPDTIGPSFTNLNLHGCTISFERRIYNAGSARELVYFGGLMNGLPLTHRLNHQQTRVQREQESTADRGNSGNETSKSETIWANFKQRDWLVGPKHFFRISTPVQHGLEQEADALLTKFVARWLVPGDFAKDSANAQAMKTQLAKSSE